MGDENPHPEGYQNLQSGGSIGWFPPAAVYYNNNNGGGGFVDQSAYGAEDKYLHIGTLGNAAGDTANLQSGFDFSGMGPPPAASLSNQKIGLMVQSFAEKFPPYPSNGKLPALVFRESPTFKLPKFPPGFKIQCKPLYSDSEVEKYGLAVPYIRKFPFEDKEEPIDDSAYYFYANEKRFPNTHELVKKFLKQARESKGYDVDCVPPRVFSSPFMPRRLDKVNSVYYGHVDRATRFAIGKINAETSRNYQLVAIEKVVDTRYLLMLLTFTAKEAGANAPVETFQATVFVPAGEGLELKEWRFKPVPASTSTSTSGV